MNQKVITPAFRVQAKLYSPATRILQKLIEMEQKLEKARPLKMGNYHLLQGEIQHKVAFSSDFTKKLKLKYF